MCVGHKISEKIYAKPIWSKFLSQLFERQKCLIIADKSFFLMCYVGGGHEINEKIWKGKNIGKPG